MEQNGFNENEFRIKFRAVFAVIIFIAVFAFLFVSVLFESVAKVEYVQLIIGFITGSLLSALIGFYYGDAESKNKTD